MAVGSFFRSIELFAIVLGILNLALLTGLVILIRDLTNPWEPNCPRLLNWLPFAGLLSSCLTLAMVTLIVLRRRELTDSRFSMIGCVVSAVGAAAFVGFLYYWNVIGLSLS